MIDNEAYEHITEEINQVLGNRSQEKDVYSVDETNRQEMEKCAPGVVCTKCKLNDSRNKSNYMPITFSGAKESVPCKILIVGEAPGNDEDPADEQFVGQSGKLLKSIINKICAKYGVSENEIAYTNICRCRPLKEDGHTKTPTPTQTKYCAPFVLHDIYTMRPQLVIAAGGKAAHALLSKSVGETITMAKYHRTIHILDIKKEEVIQPPRDRYQIEYPDDEVFSVSVCIIYHPAYVIHERMNINIFVDDVSYAFEQILYLKDQTVANPDSYMDSVTNNLLNKVHYSMITSNDKLLKYKEYLDNKNIVAVDIETNNCLNCMDPDGKIIGLSFCADPNIAIYVKLYDENLNPVSEYEDLVKTIKEILLHPTREVIGHNIKFDYKFIRAKFGVAIRMDWDTMNMAYALDSTRRSLGLKILAKMYSNISNYEDASVVWFSTYTNNRKEFWKLPDDILLTYAAGDADATYQCYQSLYAEMQDTTEIMHRFSKRLHDEVMVRGSYVVSLVEYYGIGVDVEAVKAYKQKLEQRTEELYSEVLLDELVRRYYNEIHYPKYKEKKEFKLTDTVAKTILFSPEFLGLTPTQFTDKNNPKLDKEVKSTLIEEYPGVEFIKKYAEYHSALSDLSNHIDKILNHIEIDNSIHADIRMTEVSTGRLNSQGYNVQGVPRRKDIRGLFIGRYPYRFLEMDYKQAEMRIAAEMTNDQELIKTVGSAEDIYISLASEIWGIPKSEVTKDKRQIAKTAVLSIIYRTGPKGLAASCKISIETATDVIAKFYKRYAGVRLWQKNTLDLWERSGGKVFSPLGRVRTVEKDTQACNTPVQATSSDVCLIGGYGVATYLEKTGYGRVVNIVHDSVCAEVLPEKLNEIIPAVYGIMIKPDLTFVHNMRVKLDVDFKYGYGWGSGVEFSYAQMMQAISDGTLESKILGNCH
jgi:DNA polymerase-1